LRAWGPDITLGYLSKKPGKELLKSPGIGVVGFGTMIGTFEAKGWPIQVAQEAAIRSNSEFKDAYQAAQARLASSDSAMLNNVQDMVSVLNQKLDEQVFEVPGSGKKVVEVKVEFAHNRTEAAAMRLNADKNLNGAAIFSEQGMVILGGGQGYKESGLLTRT